MPAVLFGSIGTLAETSEISREAFNQAFRAHGLDWRWEREQYQAMLEQSGGRNRVAGYARSVGQEVDAEAVHRSKSEIFQRDMVAAGLTPRPGVVETITAAKADGMRIGLVTTTSHDNIVSLLDALGPDVRLDQFDVIVDSSHVAEPKPDAAAYAYALEALGEQANGCVAIEDNADGVTSAAAAGVPCIAFPGANTAGHRFGQADRVVDRLDPTELHDLLPGR